jgi:RNA recognition motif-containing protein
MQSKTGERVSQGEEGTYVFVKGFQKCKWTHSDLHKAFESHGSIVSAKVSIDRFHCCKGYGYLQFETPEQAQKAISDVMLILK